MKVVVFGASGRVGSRVVELLLAQGHEVLAVVHSHDIFQGTPHLHVRQFDIHDEVKVAEVIDGSQAVLSCLSSWKSKSGDVLSSAMRAIVPAMKKHGVQRLVSLTGTGALTPDDNPTLSQRAGHDMMATVAPKVLADGETHMEILKASKLDWTVLRSPNMNSHGAKGYHLSAELPNNPFTTVHRQAVAQAMVDQLEDTKWARKTPTIWRG